MRDGSLKALVDAFGNFKYAADERTGIMPIRMPSPILNSSQSNIGPLSIRPVKILVDEMCENWVVTLRIEGYDDVHSVLKLRSEGSIRKGYRSVLEYAYENHMVLVTRNSKFRKDPATKKIQVILPDTYLFGVVLKKLAEYGGPANMDNAATPPNCTVKVVMDEMYDGWDCILTALGYDAHSIKKIKHGGEDRLEDDYSVITYARKKDMAIVTNDGRVGKDCRKAGIRCVLLDEEDLFGIVKEQLAKLDRSKQSQPGCMATGGRSHGDST